MNYRLRPYQQAAADAAFNEWRENTSTLLVLPTAAGKTVTFAAIVKRFLPARSLIMAHREELIFQAKDKIEAMDIPCDIEMADLCAEVNLFGKKPCVIATVQTMIKRLDRHDPNDFGLVIIDECHHSTADSYVKILDHFKANQDIRILGVTATPDRSDEEALGQVFDTVAYDYEILDAIHDGWLVPVEQQVVHVADLDFSDVRTTAGDLNGADLARVMEQEEHLQGICGATTEIIGDRQTIFFASSVIHAQKACEIFNRHRADMATFICGATDKETRRQRVEMFRDGRTQVLCNVGIATEGSDFPNVSVVAMGRPTKSRSLYAQMAGRAMRPLTGLVDPWPTADERKTAIAKSAKPAALIIDFCGNSGRHKLITSADILGGKVSDEAVERAKVIASKSKGQVRMVEVLEEAEEQLRKEREEREKRRLADEARRARLVARVSYSTRTVNPFDVLAISPANERGWDKGKVLSEKQRAVLMKQGIDGDAMPYSQAKQILDQIFDRWTKRLATFKQCAFLKKKGVDASKMTMKEATTLIDKIKANRWQFDPSMLPQKPTTPEVPF